MDAPAGDRIELRGLRVLGSHGVLPDERARPQPFSVDVDAYLDMVPAGRSDDLGRTVDYGRLVHAVVDVLAREQSFQLLEAMAEAVACRLLGLDGRVTTVSVTVRKLRPPLAADVQTAGVRVVRDRRTGQS